MKRLLILSILTTVVLCTQAQHYRFVAKVTKSGDCGMGITQGYFWACEVDSWVAEVNARTFMKQQECDACRNELIARGNATRGGCTTRITASPCIPIGGNSGSILNLGTNKGSSNAQGDQANMFVMGQTHGGSFYSVNPSNEVKDWSEEDARKRIGLDHKNKNRETQSISTGDFVYDNTRNIYLPHISSTDLITFTPINLGSNMINPEDFSISKEFLEMQKREQERLQRELEIEQQYAEIWDEIKSKLDDENYHLLKYFFQSFFGDKRPKLLKITEKGEYVFESEDENKLFSISNDAKDLQSLIFEEHSWDDENIIKAIQEDGFKDVLSDRFDFEFPILDEIKGGKISFKDLKKFSAKELKKLLPYIKAEFKLKLFDNSSKVSYEYMHLNTFDSNIAYRLKATGEGGGKDDISFSIKGTTEGKWGKNTETEKETDKDKKWKTNGEEVLKGEESDYNTNRTFGPIKIKVKAKAEIGLASIEGIVTVGVVKKLGNSYFYCSGGAELKGGLKISSKTFIPHLGLKRIIYGEGNIGGFQCKNITKSTENNIPYLQKNENSEK